jgi:uncharacterized membrane protein YhaH (DUF805 family)
MLKTYFGDVASGRIGRLRYLGLWCLLCVLTIIAVLVVLSTTGPGGANIGDGTGDIEEYIAQQVGLTRLLPLTVFVLAVVFANLNIMAKRFRDIGLSGWWIVVLIVILGLVLSRYGSPTLASGFSFVVFFALLLVPGAALSRKAAP